MNVDVTLDCSALGQMRVRGGTIEEALDAPRRATIVVHAESPGIHIEDALETDATVTLEVGDAKRTIAFVVVGVRALDTYDPTGPLYEIELAHPLALLALSRNVRPFLNKSTQDIVKAVAGGITLSGSPTGGTKPREWCVQARETDLDFFHRLLEEDGIFYFCDDAARTVTLGDTPEAFASIGGNGEVPITGHGEGTGIDDLAVEHAITTDFVTVTDWNFETPGVDLTSKTAVSDTKDGELFEWPGRYATQADGKEVARIRAEELASRKTVVTLSSNRVEMSAGKWFAITGDVPASVPTGKHLARSVIHRFGSNSYRNEVVASPFDLPYRPARDTPRPVFDGAYSCTVAGPAGQEIETDKYGRMKGLFAYDRLGKADDTASPFMRVLQPAIGGSMLLARMKWEMAVRHLDGDPDRPVAVARMYDGEHVAPEKLPDHQTKTSFETLSSPRGEKINAITIDDKGGAMMFEIKAAKDLDATILHDETETVGANDTLTIGKDDTQLVGDKQVVEIDKNDTTKTVKDAGVEVAGDRTKSITKDETVKVEGASSTRVDGKVEETVGKDLSIETKEELLESAKGNLNLTVGAAVTSKATKDYFIFVAGKSSETVGGAKSVSSSDGAITEAIGGNATVTIGAAASETVQGNRVGSAQGDIEKTIGAVGSLTAAGKLQIKAKTIKITVAGAASFVGGGGVLAVSPASIGFVGMVTFKGSGGVEITGAPQMAG